VCLHGFSWPCPGFLLLRLSPHVCKIYLLTVDRW
jgi:hypothetical protein